MTDPGMLVVLPTRGRRELAGRCIRTFRDTTDDAGLLVVTDDDDPSYEGMEWPPGVRVQVIPRTWLAAKINRIALEQAHRYRAILIVGDDHTFDTPHWDRIMMAELAKMGGTGIVYPDDKRRTDQGEICLISTDIILALGWFSHPTLKHYWADNVIADLGRAAHCYEFCPEAVITHHHYSVDPATPHDETYKYGESFGAQDFQAYQAWRRSGMAADVATVRKLAGTEFKLTIKGGARG